MTILNIIKRKNSRLTTLKNLNKNLISKQDRASGLSDYFNKLYFSLFFSKFFILGILMTIRAGGSRLLKGLFIAQPNRLGGGGGDKT